MKESQQHSIISACLLPALQCSFIYETYNLVCYVDRMYHNGNQGNHAIEQGLLLSTNRVYTMRPALFSIILVLASAIALPSAAMAMVQDIMPFEWSMPDRLLENTTIASYDRASPIPQYDPDALMRPLGGWTVDFDACAVSTSNITSYQWFVDGVAIGAVADCHFSHQFPEENAYHLSLIVTDDAGGTAVLDQEIVVQDWLIIALGDSYGSGEGNPEKSVTAEELVDFNSLFELAFNLKNDLLSFLDQLPGLEEAEQIAQQIHSDRLATRTQAAADLDIVKRDLQALLVIQGDVEAYPIVVSARNNVIAAQTKLNQAQTARNIAWQNHHDCSGILDCSTKWAILVAAETELSAAKANLVAAQTALIGARDVAVVAIVLNSIFSNLQSFDALTLAIHSGTLAVNLAQNTFDAAQAAYQSSVDALKQARDAILSLRSIIADLQRAWEEARTHAQTEYLNRLPQWTGIAPSWGTPEPTYADMVLNGVTPGEALRCHRSMISGQARAALAIEQADSHTSVTLVHLACTGAKIAAGLIDSYGGADNIEPLLEPLLDPLGEAIGSPNPFYTGLAPTNPITGQIEAAAEKILNREADAIVVSIGGNDIGFAKIIEKCVIGQPCHTDLAIPPPDGFNQAVIIATGQNCRPVLKINQLTGLSLPATESFPFSDRCLADYLITEDTPVGGGGALAFFEGKENDEGDPISPAGEPSGWTTKIEFLEGQWANLNNELKAFFPVVEDEATGAENLRHPGRVYLTEYPDPTGDDIGSYCGWLPVQSTTSGEELRNLPGVTQSEMEWADSRIATDLRNATQEAADRYQWKFITETGENNQTIASNSRNHGYCATDHWIIRIPETLITQMDPSGLAHPNRKGHENYRNAIYNQLIADFYPDGLGQTPRLPDNGQVIIDACAGLGGDTDFDGICDTEDNCPALTNLDQADNDSDGVGNVCDSTPEPVLDLEGSIDVVLVEVINSLHNGKSEKRLEKALRKLEEGDVKKGLKEIGKAVKELLKAGKKGADVNDLVDLLLESSRTEAQTAINLAIAIGGKPKEIDKALREMDKARNKSDKGKLDKAIKHYSRAWGKAQNAIK